MTTDIDDAAPGGTGVGADTGAGADKTGDQQGRGPGGRFREGQSGNPEGRRPGSRNRASLVLDALADGEAGAVLEAMVRRAKEGDLRAAELVLARAWPVRKGRPVVLDLPSVSTASGAAAAFAEVLAALAEGRLTTEEAGAVTALLEAHVRAHEAAGRRRESEKMEALYGGGISG
jgi:hypothetical protein